MAFMSSLNVIHPYTYKLLGETLQLGPCEEFAERDKQVGDLVNQALYRKKSVVRHDMFEARGVAAMMKNASLLLDPELSCLYDERIKKVTTTMYGMALMDERPEQMAEADWNILREQLTTESQMLEILGKEGDLIFIGGVLENCMANAMAQARRKFRPNGGTVAYVPELCVSVDEELRGKVEEIFEQEKIIALTLEAATRML